MTTSVVPYSNLTEKIASLEEVVVSNQQHEQRKSSAVANPTAVEMSRLEEMLHLDESKTPRTIIVPTGAQLAIVLGFQLVIYLVQSVAATSWQEFIDMQMTENED